MLLKPIKKGFIVWAIACAKPSTWYHNASGGSNPTVLASYTLCAWMHTVPLSTLDSASARRLAKTPNQHASCTGEGNTKAASIGSRRKIYHPGISIRISMGTQQLLRMSEHITSDMDKSMPTSAMVLDYREGVRQGLA
ncbi:hypothetical protein Trydic_g5229 [Trypoxylus dichotomus]